MWVDIVINVCWILMAPAILGYLAWSYFKGAEKVADDMDDDEDDFERDLLDAHTKAAEDE